MRVVYIAGPFRGPDHWAIAENIRRAERLAFEVWRLGAAALCPHLNTIHYQGSLPDRVWLDGDLEMLARCDAVLLTPDWAQSVGATAERAHAIGVGVPVFYDLDTLKGWL